MKEGEGETERSEVAAVGFEDGGRGCKPTNAGSPQKPEKEKKWLLL